MATSYDIGDQAVTRAAFTTSAGAAVDPTLVRVFLRLPDGTESILTYGVDGAVIKDSVGNYHYDWSLTVEGSHCYRWVGTGAAVAAGEKTFRVLASCFSTPL